MKNNHLPINLINPKHHLLLVGLGNPGEEYQKSRHNTGFLFIDYLANKLNLTWLKKKKLKCYLAKSEKLLLAKPITYMNNSGEAVQAIMSYYNMLNQTHNIQLANTDLNNKLLIIHDDLDIDFGKYKFSFNSRSAGNHGVESIIKHLKTKAFKRLRLGIKTELLQHISAKDFVLKNFSTEEYQIMQNLIKNISQKHFII